ncbi:MAG TPA: GAF domain-containing protein, partial [Ktedonobacteraceae bacterium]|nr:GAF domain-containing protein [Ktedonobacteraceae bacterium]
QAPGAQVTVEYLARHKNDSWAWLEATGSNYLHDPLIGAIVGNFRNVTESKQIEFALQQEKERQRLLNEASATLVSSLDHQITLQEIARLIVPAFADYCRIALLDEQGEIKEIMVNHTDPDKAHLVRALYDEYKDIANSAYGLQKLLQSGQPELISDVNGSVLSPVEGHSAILHIIRTLGLTSYMGIPLIARNRVIGALTFSSTRPDRLYTQDDVFFAQELARRIALTLDNAQLYQASQEEIAERRQIEQNLRFLAEASKLLASSLDYETTLTHVTYLAVPHIADWCSVDMRTDEGIQQLAVAHVDPEKVKWAKELNQKNPPDMQATSGLPNILRTGKPEFYPVIDDAFLVAIAHNEEELALLRLIGFRSVMVVPLLIEGKAIGAITFVSAESGRYYTQADLSMAEELASRAALAIQNARLYREAQQSRHQLEIILQGVADGILVYTPDNRLLYANEAAAHMTGAASLQELLAASPLEVVSKYELIDERGEPLPSTQLTHRRVFAGEPEAQAVIGYREPGTGQPMRWSLVTSRPVRDENGQVALVISIVHDITERMLIERRKDEFISMASHELKTPVTSLKGFTNVLQRRLGKQGDELGLHYLARMDAQLNKLTSLISDLLDISRMQSGKLALREEPIDLDALIDETVDNVQAATPTHRLRVEGRTGSQVFGDQDRLGQVFVNLLTNAIKYSPHADMVRVRLFKESDQKQAIVSVQDFGIGIDKMHHEKIFDRFYQVTDPEEKTYPGLGIGLHISSEIVARHQGRMWVKSYKGKGSTFFVALPLLQNKEHMDLP